MAEEMTMAELRKKKNLRSLDSVENLQPLFIRYDQGAYLFGVCRHSFMKIADKAEAKIKIPDTNIVLVDLQKVVRYVESCAG